MRLGRVGERPALDRVGWARVGAREPDRLDAASQQATWATLAGWRAVDARVRDSAGRPRDARFARVDAADLLDRLREAGERAHAAAQVGRDELGGRRRAR